MTALTAVYLAVTPLPRPVVVMPCNQFSVLSAMLQLGTEGIRDEVAKLTVRSYTKSLIPVTSHISAPRVSSLGNPAPMTGSRVYGNEPDITSATIAPLRMVPPVPFPWTISNGTSVPVIVRQVATRMLICCWRIQCLLEGYERLLFPNMFFVKVRHWLSSSSCTHEAEHA